MIINEYIEYMKKYKEQYGDKCIVLLQVGSFYEMYTICENNNNDNDIYKIADICGIQTTKKNKSIPEISLNNPVMAGFPIHSVSKFTQILLNNNYTIVIIQQEQEMGENKNRKRNVAEILSPGSNINITDKRSNYMMVIIYEIINNYVIAGISGIDLSTGKTFIYEVGSTKDDPELATDEVFRMISTYNPIELIILGDKIEEKEKKKILKNLNINNILVHYKWGDCKYIEFFKNIVNQTQILEKAFFMKKGLISIIELLNMEKLTISREGFCCLLQFAYEHNADIIKELQIPEILENNNNMTIEFNSAVQLNILGLYQNDKPLIDVLNRCVTAFGSRYYKEKLLAPMINIKNINKSYDDIDKLLNNNNYIRVRKFLANIGDLERFKRKVLLNKVAPQDLINFNESMEACIEIYNILEDYDKDVCILSTVNRIIDTYKDVLDMENASKYNLADKNNLGNIYLDLKNYEKAIECFEKALKLTGDKSLIYSNIGIAYNEIGDVKKLLYSWKQGLLLNKKNLILRQRYLFNLLYTFEGIHSYKEEAIEYRNNITHFDIIKKEISKNNNLERKLNVGFVSGDFKEHPVSFFLMDILSVLKKKNIELFGYSSLKVEDKYTEILKKNDKTRTRI